MRKVPDFGAFALGAATAVAALAETVTVGRKDFAAVRPVARVIAYLAAGRSCAAEVDLVPELAVAAMNYQMDCLSAARTWIVAAELRSRNFRTGFQSAAQTVVEIVVALAGPRGSTAKKSGTQPCVRMGCQMRAQAVSERNADTVVA